MIASAVRICAVLMLLAGCTSADETPSSLGDASAGAAGGGAGGQGISSSELAGQPMPGSQEARAQRRRPRPVRLRQLGAQPVATQTLDRQAAWLKQYPDVIVTVEGHADERGTREYNLALGDRRASAVKNYLVALQVSDDRILTLSYGEERPDDPGHDEAAWAQNRRAVTVVNTIN